MSVEHVGVINYDNQPLKPKRPLSCYFIYVNMRRDDVKKEHPEFGITQITKLIGEEWNKMDDT